MVTKPEERMSEPKMDATALYREDIYTDRKVGTIRRLVPVKADGSTDSARETVYVGEAQILTTVGSLPLSFEIPAQSLEEAVARYGEAAKRAVERAMQELQELRRQASSSILIPEPGAGGMGGLPGGGLPGGGLPGGGRIKLP